jgi:hypothetical protein
LFAGASRRGDIRQQLQRLAHGKFHLELKELDIELHHSHDLSKTELWDDLFKDIDQGLVDVLLVSPPCNTFSRARHHFRQGGPRPLRSATWPMGFPWLRVTDQETVQTANFSFFNVWKLQSGCMRKDDFTGGSTLRIWERQGQGITLRQSGSCRRCDSWCRQHRPRLGPYISAFSGLPPPNLPD